MPDLEASRADLHDRIDRLKERLDHQARELRHARATSEAYRALLAEQNGAHSGSSDDLSIESVLERSTDAQCDRSSIAECIFQASPAPMGIYRLDDGRLLDVNNALANLLQRPRHEMVGQPWRAAWANEDAYDALHERLRCEEMIRNWKADLRPTPDASVTVLGSFQRLSFGTTPCILMALTDVTRREEARRALVEAKDKAEDVARFRSSVLANITHEVRTPLTSILSFTSVLQSGVDGPYERFIERIERSGNRLLLMLDSLLDLAQLEAGTMERSLDVHCVHDVLHTVSGPLKERVEKAGLSFFLQLPAQRVCARFNESLLSRVLTHLVDNAVKFTSDGTVTLHADVEETAVAIGVSDTGSGIDPSFLPRIFEPFAQESEGVARAYQGSGLGLTVSRQIMEYMGGTIDIDTAPGTGTTVVLRVPRPSAS